MNLADIGQLVHQRRTALGLSQARLATLSGLSRATISQLENGSLIELGVSKLLVLLNILGIDLAAGTHKGHAQALQSISQTASVSYKTALAPAALAAALVNGHLPGPITPHIATLLDEAPLSLICGGAWLYQAVAPRRGDRLRGFPQSDHRAV